MKVHQQGATRGHITQAELESYLWGAATLLRHQLQQHIAVGFVLLCQQGNRAFLAPWGQRARFVFALMFENIYPAEP